MSQNPQLVHTKESALLNLGVWAYSPQPTRHGPNQRRRRQPSSSQTRTNDNGHQENIRRQVLQSLLVGTLVAAPQIANAGEIGARITKAVTQSDLGISVRRNVVGGAQIMDRLDGQWESFSDRFQLGQARSKQPGRPAPKVIPDPKPLNSNVAKRLLQSTDEIFVRTLNEQTTSLTMQDLQSQIQNVKSTVAPSFLRSGSITQEDMDSNEIISGAQFNFVAYTHFKAYSDLILRLQQGDSKSFKFPAFKQSFERQVGQLLIALLLPGSQSNINRGGSCSQRLDDALRQIDSLSNELVSNGLIASIDRSVIEKDRISDYCDAENGLGEDLSFSIALDGDITLGSQMLLQEQGFRLYPNFARFAVLTILQQILLQGSKGGGEVTVDDYYFDTDYNSDPDKFEVKEVLLNIELLQGD